MYLDVANEAKPLFGWLREQLNTVVKEEQMEMVKHVSKYS